MRRCALLLAFLFILPQWSALAATIDGDLSEWSPESMMGTDSNGVSLLIDWDATNLYIGWNGTDFASTTDGADLFVYLNTSENGCLLYTSPSPRDQRGSRMPSSA